MGSKFIESKVGYILNTPVQISLELLDAVAGSDVTITPEESKIAWREISDLSWDYDLENLSLAVGQVTIKFYDGARKFEELFWGNDNLECLIKIKLNGQDEFSGRVQEDGAFCDSGAKIVTLRCDSDTTKLNQTLLYDSVDGSVLNPCGFTPYTYQKVSTILEKVYQLSNPNLSYPDSIKISHSWVFHAEILDEQQEWPAVDDVPFTEIQQDINPLFFDNQSYTSQPNGTYGLRTAGDLLRKLAIDWGCATGMLTRDKAFFRRLFSFDPSDTQTLDIISHEKSYDISLIDYVKVKDAVGITAFAGTQSVMDDRLLERVNTLPGFWLAPPGISQSNIRALIEPYEGAGTALYDIYGVKDSKINSNYLPYSSLVAQFWYYYKSDKKRCRIDTFKVLGLTADFLKGFTYTDELGVTGKYQIISMTKNITAGITKIRAINCGS